MADFVSAFSDYVSTLSDSPPDYHATAALALLSAAAGTGVWADGWGDLVYPTIWAILLGRSGMGKDAPIKVGGRLLGRAKLEHRLHPPSFSYEGFVNHLKSQPVGVLLLPEFGSFLGQLARQYNQGMRELLTEVYDVPPVVKRTLVRETVVVHKPAVTLLSAATPRWFARVAKVEDLTAGFLSRFSYCYSQTPGPEVPVAPPLDDAVEAALGDHLQEVSRTSGRMTPADARTLAAYRRFQTETRRELRARPETDLSGLEARTGVLVTKCAMLFALSRDPGTLAFDEGDLGRAIDYVRTTHKTAEQFLAELPQDQEDAWRQKVLGLLEDAGGTMFHSTLLRRSHLSAKQLGQVTRTLKDAELLAEQGTSRGRLWVLLAGERTADGTPTFRVLAPENSHRIRENSQNSRPGEADMG